MIEYLFSILSNGVKKLIYQTFTTSSFQLILNSFLLTIVPTGIQCQYRSISGHCLLYSESLKNLVIPHIEKKCLQ